MSKLYISIIFFSFLTSNGEVWGGKKAPKEDERSSKDVPESLEAQIIRARAELARLEAFQAQQEPQRRRIREIMPVDFSKETRDLVGEYPKTLGMMHFARYHENAATETFKRLEELFPLIKNRKDQIYVIEGIQNNINKHPDTPETEILKNFLRDQNLDQVAQEESQIKNIKIKKIHKKDK